MSMFKPCHAAIAALLVSATPIHAQGNQEGLVNINVEDNTVQVPVGVAAQVCPNIDANVLAEQFVGSEEIACDIDQETAAQHNIGGGSPGAGGGQGQQNGLVNVDVDGNTVQIPVGVAAQVCPDVDANMLAAQFVGSDEIACNIDQATAAENDLPGFEDTADSDAADVVEDTTEALEDTADDAGEAADEAAGTVEDAEQSGG